jgi:hypothetical protein
VKDGRLCRRPSSACVARRIGFAYWCRSRKSIAHDCHHNYLWLRITNCCSIVSVTIMCAMPCWKLRLRWLACKAPVTLPRLWIEVGERLDNTNRTRT